jgi:hypothetical protein
MQQSHSSSTLSTWIRQDVTQTRRLVQIFFAEIHRYWPILHAPTFELQNASDLLLGAILMLSSWITGTDDHVELASAVLEEVMAATSPVRVGLLIKLQRGD